jgi:hypothetical protein
MHQGASGSVIESEWGVLQEQEQAEQAETPN